MFGGSCTRCRFKTPGRQDVETLLRSVAARGHKRCAAASNLVPRRMAVSPDPFGSDPHRPAPVPPPSRSRLAIPALPSRHLSPVHPPPLTRRATAQDSRRAQLRQFAAAAAEAGVATSVSSGTAASPQDTTMDERIATPATALRPPQFDDVATLPAVAPPVRGDDRLTLRPVHRARKPLIGSSPLSSERV